MKSLPATLLQLYKKEYEQTDITIKELCEKYDITTKQLKGYTKWTKEIKDPIVTQTPSHEASQPTNQILDDIEEFKKLAVRHAVNFIKEDARFAEVKEFKDMVAIVDTIEKSYKNQTEQGPTINIAIQNLVERFKDDV